MSPRMVQLCHLGTYPFNRKVNKSDTGQMCEQAHNTYPPFHDRGIHWRQTPFCFLILRFSHLGQGLQLIRPSLEWSQKRKRCTPPLLLFFTFFPTFSTGIFSSASQASVSATPQTSTLGAKSVLRCTN